MKEEVKRWWIQAFEDLDTAQVNLNAGKYYATILFCQQAIEKGLKALWLKEKNEDMPHTHDLTLLGKKLELSKEFSIACKELTSAYTETRYPDSSDIAPSKNSPKQTR